MNSLSAITVIVFALLLPVMPVHAEKPEVMIGGMAEATARSWWAFQALPAAAPTPSPTAIDAFINRALADRGLSPVPPADPRSLYRRMHYGLTGLPPEAKDVEAFVKTPSSEAWNALMEQLLASPQYGVHWGRRWLDVARYADTAGENTDRPLPHAWRYRNWVIDAFNADLPYDRFVQLQLAGDILAKDGDEKNYRNSIVATGYLAIARRFGHDTDEDIHLMYEDVIDNLGKAFLGLTTSCARCHDHKYDPITARDYYALYGIFDSSRFSFSGCEKKGQPRDLVPLLPPAQAEALLKPWMERQAVIDAENKRRETAAKGQRSRLKELFGTAPRLLADSQVAEGASVPFKADAMNVRKGEILQLTVLPNASHGADSTLLEWTIRRDGSEQRWSLADLVPDLFRGNPYPAEGNAAWVFLEPGKEPFLLGEKHQALQDRKELKKWSRGDLPSVFVNTSAEAVKVWTTLPAKSFFVHPAPNRPVAVAWVSPFDGTISTHGRVADAHPSGGDGVAFTLKHFAAPELGAALAGLGVAEVDLPANGPRPEIPVAYAVVEATAKNTRLHLRGEPDDPGEEIPRGWLGIFGGAQVPPDAGSGRRELGNWIAHHPIAARVMVNRIWQGHFGEGLVRTPNDFGARGERPTHPELLDWLAAQFVESGYSVKAMHRLILRTKAYRRSSVLTDALREADPNNRRLARFERRRLSAEELRDSLLQVSGGLNRESGGPHPFPPEAGWKFTQHNPFTAVYESDQRSAYLMVQRQRRHPFLALFDGADPNASSPERETTTVPTQALFFLNDPWFHAQARRFAETLTAQAEDNEARLERATRTLFQRGATPGDHQRAHRFLTGYPGSPLEQWSAYARVLMAGNEFMHLD